jgi:chemosensory pili system protein ChpA (sensor histidine kinase/response regulator)
MNAVSEFDLGPLTWVKPEIDLALGRAEQALGEYRTSGDATLLKFCRTHVHQVYGALSIVGLDGVTQIIESLEALLLAIEEGNAADPSSQAPELSMVAIHAYLDDLIAGEANQPLRLLPVHAALAAARGLPPPRAGELFFPDCSQRPPRRETPLVPLSADALQALLKSERARFQKALLDWLNTPDDLADALAPMRQVVARIEASQEGASARAFWWVALAFMESLPTIDYGDKAALCRVFARIDLQIRHLLEGSSSVAGRLMRDALYGVALAPRGTSATIDGVQDVFQLPGLIPAATASKITSPDQDGILRRLREALASAEDFWAKVCSGNLAALPGFVQHASHCAQLTEALGSTDLKRLGQGFAAVARWVCEDAAHYSDNVAMEVATAILLLQNAQENFRRLGGDFAQQVDLMVDRLYACIAGRSPASREGLPLLDEMSRRAQERLLIGQVGREIQNNLAQIEQTLDIFFRNPQQPNDIAGLAAQFKQIAGALTMLGHFGAVKALNESGARIQKFSRPDFQPVAGEFEAVADELSQLGFFVDALKAGETSYDAFLQRLARSQESLAADAPGAATPSFEAELQQQKQETQTLFDAYKEAPENNQLRDELRQNLESLQIGADLVEDPELGEVANTVLKALEAGEALEPAVDQALSQLLPPVVELPLPSPETLILAESSVEEIDAELLSIFLEEAVGVLASMAQHRALLAADPLDTEALTTIRRASHTLKGSGRMVGLVDLGEAAWSMEQTLNKWLRQELPVTADLQGMIDEAHALFVRWVAALENKTAAPDPSALVVRCERLRGLESPAPVLPAPIAAVENQASIPAETHLEAAAAALEDLLVGVEQNLRSTSEMTADSTPEEASSAPEMPVIPAPPALTLYDIFRDEAGDHLRTLLDAYAVLDAHPAAPTTFEMTRAAHTLGGIAATVGLMPLNHLAIALEHALLRRDNSGRADSIEGLETVRQAIMTLESLFATLLRGQPLVEQTQLIAALNDIFIVHPAAEAAASELDSVEPASPLPAEAGIEIPAAKPQIMAQLRDDLDEQLLPIFLEEADQHLSQLTAQLRLWRGDLTQNAAPSAIARLLHTFKGNARMAGAMNLGELTHLLETRVGDGLRAGVVTAAFIDEIENGCDLLALGLEGLRSGEATLPAALVPEGQAAIAVDMGGDREGEASQQATLRVRAELIDRLVNEAGELSIARARIEGEMRNLKTSLLELTENVIRLRRQLRDIEIQAEGQIQARVARTPEGDEQFDPLELDRFTRFQELSRFMAESVNDVATVQQSLLKNLDDANAALIDQSRLNRALQQELMGIRMLPFASQSERLYRIVRQTAKEVGKRANLEIKGGQVEVDRSVLDKMLAPLEHMLRNAVTHGIESRAARLAAGKSETGEITITLAQEANEIILAVADDGGGLDKAAIRARAEAAGLLAPAAEIDEARLVDFIFAPGFSTASELSQVSGRGVGMDVVKTEVAALGGRIEIVSEAGQGSNFRLYLPLTLAVTQTVLVRAGAQLFAIPSTMIEQVMEIKEAPLASLREKGEVEWMDRHYPLHYLAHLLGDGEALPEVHRRYWVLLLRSGSQRVAVQVDELRGNREVVVKNVGAQLARLVGISGATVLGDGEVVLILNPVALAGRAPVPSVRPAAPVVAPVMAAVVPTVMVVDDSLTVRKITSRLLTREGYQVLLAKDGVDAIEQLIDTLPDVVLSDIEMPRMDGFDLLRNIRSDRRLKHLPVIIITSRTAEKHRKFAMEIGANHYLGKPYDEDELLSLVASYL